jgi:hypothetical protein
MASNIEKSTYCRSSESSRGSPDRSLPFGNWDRVLPTHAIPNQTLAGIRDSIEQVVELLQSASPVQSAQSELTGSFVHPPSACCIDMR